MQDFRKSVVVSLNGKINEHEFFLKKIIETVNIIEKKILIKGYSLNSEPDELNYFYSAYLNTIQSLKDSFEIAIDTKIDWVDIFKTDHKFIRFCRIATTHDGNHLINAMKDGRCYIAGPLRRFNDKGKLITFDVPTEDVLSLCCKITNELLYSLSNLLKQNESKILVPNEVDIVNSVQVALNSDFLSPDAKEMLNANRVDFEVSLRNYKIDYINDILDNIDRLKQNLSNCKCNK